MEDINNNAEPREKGKLQDNSLNNNNRPTLPLSAIPNVKNAVVYFMGYSNNGRMYVKVGLCQQESSLKKRVKALQTGNPHKIHILTAIRCYDDKNSKSQYLYEKIVRNHFVEQGCKKEQGEWISFPEQEKQERLGRLNHLHQVLNCYIQIKHDTKKDPQYLYFVSFKEVDLNGYYYFANNHILLFESADDIEQYIKCELDDDIRLKLRRMVKKISKNEWHYWRTNPGETIIVFEEDEFLQM